MIGRTVRVIALVLASLGLVVACGSSNRPENLSLDEVKPCQLILAPKREALNVTRGPIPMDTDGGVGTKGSSCKYYVVYGLSDSQLGGPLPTNNTVLLTVVTNHGVDWKVDEASDDKNFYFKDVRRVQGFRAVRVWSTIQPPGPNTKCELYVDVADEQMLRVYVPGSSGKTDPPTCETARRFAKAALKTLRARQGD